MVYPFFGYGSHGCPLFHLSELDHCVQSIFGRSRRTCSPGFPLCHLLAKRLPAYQSDLSVEVELRSVLELRQSLCLRHASRTSSKRIIRDLHIQRGGLPSTYGRHWWTWPAEAWRRSGEASFAMPLLQIPSKDRLLRRRKIA